MYSGFRQRDPWAWASLTSTRNSPGFSRLKSAKRCVAPRYREGEGPETTCGREGREQSERKSYFYMTWLLYSKQWSAQNFGLKLHRSKRDRNVREAEMADSQKDRSSCGCKRNRPSLTLAPPDCSSLLKPASLVWSMFSITTQPLNAP